MIMAVPTDKCVSHVLITVCVKVTGEAIARAQPKELVPVPTTFCEIKIRNSISQMPWLLIASKFRQAGRLLNALRGTV